MITTNSVYIQSPFVAVKNGGVGQNIFTTFQAAYNRANEMQMTNGGIITILVGETTAAETGNLILTGDFNHNIQIVGENNSKSILGNIIATNNIGNGFSVGKSTYIFDSGYLVDEIIVTCTFKYVTIGNIDCRYLGSLTGAESSGHVRCNLTSAILGHIDCSLDDSGNTGSISGIVNISGNQISCAVGNINVFKNRSGFYSEEFFYTEPGATIYVYGINSIGSLTARTNIAHTHNTINVIFSTFCSNLTAASVFASNVNSTGQIFCDTANILSVTSGQQYVFYSPNVTISNSTLQYCTVYRTDAMDSSFFRLSSVTVNTFAFNDTSTGAPINYTLVDCIFTNTFLLSCATFGNSTLVLTDSKILNLYSSVTLSKAIIRLIAGQIETVISKGITAATSFLFSNFHTFDSIVIRNNTTNAITGGIKIGSSAGGTQHLNTIAVGSNANVSAIESAISARYASAGTSIYIDAVTSWNAASITVILTITNSPTSIL